jgi:hypothetical protein
MAPKGKRLTKRFYCICETLPAKNQGGLITKFYASVVSNSDLAALFIRVTEEEEPMPVDLEYEYQKKKLQALVGKRR